MKDRIRRFALPVLAAGFLLGVRDGKIALWAGTNPEPVRIFSTPPACLPREDQQALARGIPAESREELAMLLEDFFS